MQKRKTVITVAMIFAAFIFLNYYTLPYYVSRPGIAKVLDEVIEVEDGFDNEGEFMLTTIRMGKANLISYFMTKINKYYELEPLETVKLENESDEEYHVRQLYYMENSQENALQVAFKKAGKEIDVKMQGIYVLSVLEGSPADGILQPGDLITKIDGESFNSSVGYTDYIQEKQHGDEIEVSLIRKSKEHTKAIIIEEIQELGKPGIGISLVEDKNIETNPPVFIDTNQIGGPSAGLMFTLEIYNQLMDEDITKGYSIAGTGTITPDGTVGPIGGIEQKIVAADDAGAEIFFAPNENGAENSNYENAVITAKDINTDMKVVPVDTIDDALEFLDQLGRK